MEQEIKIFKKDKKGWVVNLIGGIIVVLIVFTCVMFILDINAIEKKATSACEAEGLDYRAKPCGFACVEYQCFNETDLYELIMENNKTILHKI